MGHYENIFVIRLITLSILLIISLSSCKSIYFYNWKDIDCSFDDSIKEQDRKLNMNDTISTDSLSVNILRIDAAYAKIVTYNYKKIQKVLVYDENFNLSNCYFLGIHYDSKVDIGNEYYFDKHGNIIQTINTDKGYNICWKQAIYIGDMYTHKKRSIIYPKTWLEKKQNSKKNTWRYFYTNKKNKRRVIVINGNNGKVMKTLDVQTDY